MRSTILRGWSGKLSKVWPFFELSLNNEQFLERIEIQKIKTKCRARREEADKDMIEIRKLANRGPQKQIFRWEDQEIYYFSMALKEYGKNYDLISKIIPTKQVQTFDFRLSSKLQWLLQIRPPKNSRQNDRKRQEF